MRTTLDIDDDILQAAKELARAEKKTAGQVLSELARKGLTQPMQAAGIRRGCSASIRDERWVVRSDGSRRRRRHQGAGRSPHRGGRFRGCRPAAAEEGEVGLRALLDVSVLLPLFDARHTQHAPARGWWALHGDQGWASCPLTQNGFARIISKPGYARPIDLQTAFSVLLDQAEANRPRVLARRHLHHRRCHLRPRPHPRAQPDHGRLSARPGGQEWRAARDLRSGAAAEGRARRRAAAYGCPLAAPVKAPPRPYRIP